MSDFENRDEGLARLVAAAKAGDNGACEQLLLMHLPDLRAFIRLQADPELRMRESTSDLVQTVCREVIAGLDEFEWRDEASFRGWFYTVALNKVRGKRRFHSAAQRSVRREDGASDEALLKAYAVLQTPSVVAMRREDAARIEAAFDQLSEEHREVILLSRLLALPHREVARRMGRSEVAVRSLLSRALVALSGLLDERT